jgi:hypothetical protein
LPYPVDTFERRASCQPSCLNYFPPLSPVLSTTKILTPREREGGRGRMNDEEAPLSVKIYLDDRAIYLNGRRIILFTMSLFNGEMETLKAFTFSLMWNNQSIQLACDSLLATFGG